MKRRDDRFQELNVEFKLEVLSSHYLGAYDEGLSEDDDLYIELLNDPEKLEQTLKDEFGSGERYGVKYILEYAWDNYRRYGYI